MEGSLGKRYFPNPENDIYGAIDEPIDILMKVETHNHPTAISPFPGAATGSGGEIRDEGATGRGAKPKAGLTGFSVSHLRIPGFEQPWENRDELGKPDRIVSALDIMIEGPIGGAAFNNEFGRPNICGYFRSFEQAAAGDAANRTRGYHKPIMIAGGLGNVRRNHVEKSEIPVGAESRRARRAGDAHRPRRWRGVVDGQRRLERGSRLRLGAARQSGNSASRAGSHRPLQRALESQSHPADPRRGRGRFVECGARSGGAHAGTRRRHRPRARFRTTSPACRRWNCGATNRRSATCWSSTPAKLDDFASIARRERCPFAVIGEINGTGVLVLEDRKNGTRPVDLPLDVLLGKAPKMLRDVRRVTPPQAPLALADIDLRDAAYRLLQFPGGGRQDLPDFHRRSHRGRHDQPRPDGGAVAGSGRGRRRDHL